MDKETVAKGYLFILICLVDTFALFASQDSADRSAECLEYMLFTRSTSVTFAFHGL